MISIRRLISAPFKIVILICIFNFVFLIGSVFVAEFVTGDEVLNSYISPSKNIDEGVMFIEDEEVTFVFKTQEQIMTEVINISIVDPQNMEYSWQKGFGGFDEDGVHSNSGTVFTPKSSGIHQIKISDANFHTDVKLVSGMLRPTEQPLFLKTLLLSTLFMVIFVILFGEKRRRVSVIPGLPITKEVSTGNRVHFSTLQTLIALTISLLIIYFVVFKSAI